MSDWLIEQLDYAHMVCGLLCVLMGAALTRLSRRSDQVLPWRWLAWFGFLAGGRELTQVLSGAFDTYPTFRTIELTLLLASSLCMLEFARLGMSAIGLRSVGRWVAGVPLVAVLILSQGGHYEPSAAVQVCLTIPAAVCFAIIVFEAGRACDSGRGAMWCLGGLLLMGSLSGGPWLPLTHVIHTSDPMGASTATLAGVPIQLLHLALLAFALSSVWWFDQITDKYVGMARNRWQALEHPVLVTTLAMVLVAGWLLTDQFADARRQEEAWDDTMITTAAASMIDGSLIERIRHEDDADALQARELLQAQMRGLPIEQIQVESYRILIDAGGGRVRSVLDSPGSAGDFTTSGLSPTPIQAAVLAAIQSGKPAVIGTYLGDGRPLLSTAGPIRLPDGRTVGALVLHTDGRERQTLIARNRLATILITLLFSLLLKLFYVARRNWRQITDSLRKLSRAVEQCPASIVITDREGRIEYVNPKFTQVNGYTLAEAIGCNPSILKSGLNSPEIYQALWKAITSGKEWRGELANKRKNGEIYWEMASISPVVDQFGATTHYLAVKEDITERKRTDEELRRSLSLLSATLESTADGILAISSDGQRITFNQKFATIKGITVEGASACSEVELMELAAQRVQDPESFHARLRSIQNDPAASSFDLITQNDGRIVERSSQPQFIDGKVVGRVWSFRDVTDIKSLLGEQEVNIDLAKQLLAFVRGETPCSVDLGQEHRLFIDPHSVACKAAGGDHYLVRVLPARGGHGERTVISLRDQSGHEVNCILRSIATDLLHDSVLADPLCQSLEQEMESLNNRLCRSGVFGEGDFLTAITLEIDNESRLMRFASCGHPSLVLIRGDYVQLLPGDSLDGKNLPLGNLAEALYSVAEVTLEAGDRVLLYTDGLTEMPMRCDGPRLGGEAFRAVVADVVRGNPTLPVSQIVQHVLKQVTKLSCVESALNEDNMIDDVTLIGLEVESTAPMEEIVLHPIDSDHLCDELERIFGVISNRFRTAGFSGPDTRLRITLEESVLNAWKHGNRARPGSAIRVRWRCHNDLVLEVIDEGDGFDPSTVSDPRSLSCRMAEHGRGIFMIRRMCDSVRWRDGGRRLVASYKSKVAA